MPALKGHCYFVWSPPAPKLLPRTDEIAFMRDETDTTIYADWDRVCEFLGHLLKPAGM